LGNWEIDVGVLDEDLAVQMEALFLADLASSVEIVLPSGPFKKPPLEDPELAGGMPAKATLDPGRTLQERLDKWRQGPRGATAWRVSDLVRAGSALGDAIAGHRTLGREDRTVLGTLSSMVLFLAAVSAFFPWVIGWLVAVVAGWLGIVLAVRAIHQARRARRDEELHSPSPLTEAELNPPTEAEPDRPTEAEHDRPTEADPNPTAESGEGLPSPSTRPSEPGVPASPEGVEEG
jgi:hypothetical protein